MFHQFPPTNKKKHLIAKNLHLLATFLYRRDSLMSTLLNQKFDLYLV